MSAYAIDFPDSNDPNFDPDAPFEAPNGITYTWNGYGWVAECGGAGLDDEYLKRYGDTVDDADDDVTYTWNDGVIIKSEEDGFTGVQLESSHSKLRVFTDDGEGDVKIEAGDTFSSLSGANYIQSTYRTTITSTTGDVYLTASAGAERVDRIIDGSDIDEQIVNKRYVDDQKSFLQNEIIELEEEIEAIAITSERGEWVSATSINSGEFRMIGLGGNTIEYDNSGFITSLAFNNVDADGVTHGWGEVEVGNIIELLDKPDTDYGIFEITAINITATSTSFDVDYIKGVGQATHGDRTRIKIFEKPTGGNLEDYVRIAGDTMTGALAVDAQDNTIDGAFMFSIEGDQADGGTGDNLLVARRHASQGDQIRYYGPVTFAKEVTTKEYVDEHDLVEVLAGTPSSTPVGKMWFDTTKNALYIKTGS